MNNALEAFRPVIGFEGMYEISDRGTIKRVREASGTKAGKVLKPYLRSTYPCVDLALPGSPNKTKAKLVHCLVAETFLGPRPPKHNVNHIDGDKINYDVNNLEYVSQGRNVEHTRDVGLRHESARRLAVSLWRCEGMGITEEIFALAMAIAAGMTGVVLK